MSKERFSKAPSLLRKDIIKPTETVRYECFSNGELQKLKELNHSLGFIRVRIEETMSDQRKNVTISDYVIQPGETVIFDGSQCLGYSSEPVADWQDQLKQVSAYAYGSQLNEIGSDLMTAIHDGTGQFYERILDSSAPMMAAMVTLPTGKRINLVVGYAQDFHVVQESIQRFIPDFS